MKKIKDFYLEVKEDWYDMMEWKYGPIGSGLWIFSFMTALIGLGVYVFLPLYMIYKLIKKLRGKA